MKQLLRLAAFASLCLAGAVSFSSSSVKADGETGWSALPSDFSLEYKLGETINIPTLTYQGATLSSTTLIFPDGTAKYGDSIPLTQPGIYTLQYTAKKDGVPHTLTYDITVKNTLYTLTSSKSSASYMTYSKHGEGEGSYSNLKRYPNMGLFVSLAKGDTLTFTEPIPLSNFDGSEFIQGFVVPKNPGTADFNSLDVVLTDTEDPSRYITFNLLRHTDTNRYTTITSVKVAGNGQPLTGFEGGKNIYHVNNIWGTTVIHSFTDIEFFKDPTTGEQTVRTEIPASKFQFILGYDNATKTCYAGQNNNDNGVGYHTLSYCADLDSLDAFENIWSGFTSSSVYLSIKANTYSSQTADFMLTYVRDVEDLSLETVDDTVGPELTVNTTLDPNAMPEAYVGKRYTVPTATAHDDVSGKRPVDIYVDYNYLSGNPEDIAVENGTFLTDRAGIYRIRYVALDSFRNKTEKIYYVHAGGSIDSLTVTPAQTEDNAKVGLSYDIPAFTTSGGSGTHTTSISYEFNGVVTPLTSSSFTPEVSGDYRIICSVKDFAGAESEGSYTLHVSTNPDPVIPNVPTLPAYYLVGSTYTLPECVAYDYSSGTRKETTCQVEVTMNGSTNTYQSGAEFTPAVANNGDKISLRYFAGSTSLDTIEVPAVVVAKNNLLQMANYFVGAENEVSLGRTGAAFMAKVDGSTITWTFANTLPAQSASVTIGNQAGKSQMAGMKITFRDADDASIAVSATLVFGKTDIVITVGDLSFTLEGSFIGDSSFGFQVSLNDNILSYQSRDSDKASNLPITKDDNGNAFNGFSGDLVYLSVTAYDVALDNGYLVTDVAGNTISSFVRNDTAAPGVYSTSAIGGMYSLGSEYTIAASKAYDVLAPNSSITMTVLDPNDNVVTDVDGVRLENIDPSEEHTIVLSVYGIYHVNLTAQEDGWLWNNSSLSAYTIECIDTTAPSLALSVNMPSTVKVGDIIYLPPVIAHDDLTKDEDLKIFACVILPTGRQIQLQPKEGVRASIAGDYDFFVFAMDEFGNSTCITRTVTAK